MLKHLACVMDGNRRWAKKNSFLPWEGHKEGVEAIKRAVSFCIERSISYLSLYTFSLENFRRSEYERNFLFAILPPQIHTKVLDFLMQNNVRASFIGDRASFPDAMKPFIADIETQTANNTGLQLNFLFCYGARQEIVAGVKKLARQVKLGEIQEDEITDSLLEKTLWMGAFPAPDLIVRTGGASRLSNFMVYQGAYSEWYFTPQLWPEIQKEDLEQAVTFFNTTQRNFGQ